MDTQIYKVRDPSGNIREISGPVGATDDEVIEQAKILFADQKVEEKGSDVLGGKRASEKASVGMTGAARGAVESAGQMITGAAASAIGGLRGLYGLATGDSAEEAARKVQATQQAMTYQPRTKEGQAISEAIAMPMEYASKATGYLGGKVGGMFGPRGEAAGETIGEIIPPIAATMLTARPAIKSIRETGFVPPSAPEIPIVSDAVRGLRDVGRTRTKEGPRLLAEEYIKKMTTPEEAPKIVSALERRAASVVPESPVTAADAIVRANREMALKGKPERFGGQYVALQEGLASLPETSSGLTGIKLLQEQARSNVMKAGAGTERGYAAAELARKSATAPLYKKLAESNAIVDTAKTVNLIDRIVESKSGNRALVTALDDVKASLVDKMDDANAYILKSNPGVLKSSVDNINSLLTKQENAAIRRELMTVKKSLENQITRVESAYGEAQKAYAVNSLPLNQMDLWKAMQDKFITPTGKEAPGSYLKALRDEAKLIKQATGFKRGTDIKNIFNQEQSSLAARLAAEMEMELLKKRMAGEVNIPGIGKAAEGLEPRLPNMLMRETMVANFILRTLAKNANVDVNIAAANILKDPKQLAGVLKQIKPEHRSTALKTIRETAATKAGVAVGTALMETEEQ